MADLGTSIGLQGQYNNDYMQNLQLQEQKRGNIADELFRQQEAERKQKQIAEQAMADAVTIPKGRFLPQREDEIKQETINLLDFANQKREKNTSYNPEMDSDFQRRRIELMSKAKTYEAERIRAEEDLDEMTKNSNIYDPRSIKEGLAVLNGEVPFSESMKNRLYQVPKIKDFSKYTDLDKHLYTAGVLDFANEKKQIIENGEIKEVGYEGYDFRTPEKQNEQKLKAIEYVKENRNDPYIQRLIQISEKNLVENAPQEGIDLQSKPKEVIDSMIDVLAAEEIIKTAKNSRYNKTKDFEKPMPRQGKGFNQNITFTAGGGGSSKIWNVSDAKEAPLYEVKDGKKTNKAIGDYYYHAIQTVAAGENPKKFNIAGYTDVQIEGVNVNKKTGKPEYIDITIPPRYNKYDKVIDGTGIKKTVRITEPTEIENLRTNLGAELYDKTIGNHKPMKEESKTSNQVQTIQGKKIPAGGIPKYSAKTGQLIGYELNGEKFKF